MLQFLTSTQSSLNVCIFLITPLGIIVASLLLEHLVILLKCCRQFGDVADVDMWYLSVLLWGLCGRPTLICPLMTLIV